MYNEKSKGSTLRYKKKLKRVEVAWTSKEYKEEIEPAVIKSGLPLATFIKKAIGEKIEREKEE